LDGQRGIGAGSLPPHAHRVFPSYPLSRPETARATLRTAREAELLLLDEAVRFAYHLLMSSISSISARYPQ